MNASLVVPSPIFASQPRSQKLRETAASALQPVAPGAWYLPCDELGSEVVYDRAYFERYAAMSQTVMSTKLNAFRRSFVRRRWHGELVDVGIGCGAFINAMPPRKAFGYDINPVGAEWLRQRELYWDLYRSPANAATFWDSLEHIPVPKEVLDQVRFWAFVSIPIFDDLDHVLRSKHFRPNEHYWYFTEQGFKEFAEGAGFCAVETSTIETALGRESIMSFALRRRTR